MEVKAVHVVLYVLRTVVISVVGLIIIFDVVSEAVTPVILGGKLIAVMPILTFITTHLTLLMVPRLFLVRTLYIPPLLTSRLPIYPTFILILSMWWTVCVIVIVV